MCQYVASSVMLRVHRVEVLFWWFWVLGDLQGAHWEYQKALDAHNNNSYAREVVDGPRRFIAKTACNKTVYHPPPRCEGRWQHARGARAYPSVL